MNQKNFVLIIILIVQSILLSCSVSSDSEKDSKRLEGSNPTEQTEANCSLCHGFPPNPPHLPKTNCESCHEVTIDEDGKFDINASSHMNGTLNILMMNCNSCHGNGSNNAPPSALDNETSTSFLSVGAHQEHLNANVYHGPISCNECHLVPSTPGQEGHIDYTITPEISWGEMATNKGAQPIWDRSTGTCSNTYCHGGTLVNAGGAIRNPVWTIVDQSQVACDSCHGYPPTSPRHGGGTNCKMCHYDSNLNSSVLTGNTEIDHSFGLHMDGGLQVYGFETMLKVTGPKKITTGLCQKYHVAFTDLFGVPSIRASEYPFTFSVIGNGAYYDDNSCSVVLTTKSLPSGTTNFDFYYKNDNAENGMIYVRHTLDDRRTSDSQFTVVVISSPPTNLIVNGNLNQFPGLCSDAITIESKDDLENISVVAIDTTVSFTQNAGVQLYSNPDCTGTQINNIQISSGQSRSSNFYLKYSGSNRLQVTASTSGLIDKSFFFNIPTYLKMPNQDSADLAGQTVAISGNTIVISAPYEKGDGSSTSNNDFIQAGAAYIYVDANGDGDWSDATFQAYLKAPTPKQWDDFGASIAISDSTIAIGSPREDNGTTSNNGAVYIFVDPNKDGDWTDVVLQKTIRASNKDNDDYFGASVAIAGSTIVVGANFEDGNGNSPTDNSSISSGAVYVFSDINSDGDWSDVVEQAYLKASNTGSGDQFGKKVSISGNTIIVNSIYEDSNDVNDPSDNSMKDSGAVYLFTDPNSDGTWSDVTEQAYLKGPTPGVDFYFGSDLDISGSTIVVGSEGYNYRISSAVYLIGAAYIFSDPNNDGNWADIVMQKELLASDRYYCDKFGKSVSISGSSIAIGGKLCYNGERSPIKGRGSVYIFSDINSDGTWTDAEEISIIKAPNSDPNDLFGDSLDISGNNIIIGSPNESSDGSSTSNNDSVSSGAVYVY